MKTWHVASRSPAIHFYGGNAKSRTMNGGCGKFTTLKQLVMAQISLAPQ